ncbi:replication initiator protein [Sigmofec virus UA08Rod_6079]|uniref:Replication initiator protein n=1 Tax=Sigmofec virus UA08Rod_6079 TaxID=2929450 RepID=A0A976N1U2_9VIRU|nr:replication initiator protein [Sigmofec virus UA08Rod_6079]
MPCLNPLKIRNPKYKPTKKNDGVYDLPEDPRDLSLLVPCGKCVECRRRRASDWRFRMHQEYKYSDKSFYFITMTFNDESLKRLINETSVDSVDADYNSVVIFAVRRFLERYRKKYKVSLRHLFVTELGGEYDRIHVHGLIIGSKTDVKFHHKRYGIPVYRSPELEKLWSYGFIYLEGCSERCVSYILKYIMKQDPQHPDYKPCLLVSPGLGKDYCNSSNIVIHHSIPGGMWYCVASSGWKVAMPRYYKLKIFTEEEREARRKELLDNPPPFVFHGREFDSEESYRLFIYNYFRRTLALKVSFRNVKKPRIIFENLQF